MSNTKGQLHATIKPLDGAEGLLVAVIARVIEDIRHPRPTPTPNTSAPSVAEQLLAVEWLLNGQQLAEYADLLGLDCEWLQHELLRAAGLCQGTPRLGQRRGTRPMPRAAPDVHTSGPKSNGRSVSPDHYATKTRRRSLT